MRSKRRPLNLKLSLKDRANLHIYITSIINHQKTCILLRNISTSTKWTDFKFEPETNERKRCLLI